MIYTVWEKVNTETYKFYMAAEDSTVAIRSAPIDAVITETELWFTFNYMTADELAHYKWLPVTGLSKERLIKHAIDRVGSKQQWFSGESVRLAEDAFLKNDDGFVRLYRSDKSGKYPKVTRLATVFWLDPGNIEAGWQRYTEAQRAREELFSP